MTLAVEWQGGPAWWAFGAAIAVPTAVFQSLIGLRKIDPDIGWPFATGKWAVPLAVWYCFGALFTITGLIATL